MKHRAAHLTLVGFLLLNWVSTASAASIQYIYDDLGRLVRVERSEGIVVTYTYDAVGNRLSRKIIHDYDFDDVADAADNCPQGYNPAQGPGVFAEQIVASDKNTFSWSRPFDVEYVRGDLAVVSTYAASQQVEAESQVDLEETEEPTGGEEEGNETI